MAAGVLRDQLHSLQSLRGLAAAAVVFEHLHFHSELRLGHGLVPAWFAAGHLGVDMFFVLSGFILLHVHRSDLGQDGQVRRYAWRRFVRIWPLLALLNTVKLVYMGISGAEVRPEKSSWDVILTSYLCLPHPQWPLLDVAWTLRHEALFYALFAVAVAYGPRVGLLLTGAAAAALVIPAMVGAQPEWPWWQNFVLSPLHWHFLFGLAAAWIVQRPAVAAFARGPMLYLAAGLTLALATALMAAGASFHLRSGADMPRVLFAAGAALLVCTFVLLERRHPRSHPSWLTGLGDASYSLYLWHGFVVAGALAVTPSLPAWLQHSPILLLTLVTAAAFVSSFAVYRWIELPLLRALRR